MQVDDGSLKQRLLTSLNHRPVVNQQVPVSHIQK
jgi:hypothetical protein